MNELAKQIADAVEQTELVLKTRGWTKYKPMGEHGEFCLTAAVRYVTDGKTVWVPQGQYPPYKDNLEAVVKRELMRWIPKRNMPVVGVGMPLVAYNDSWWRMKWEVLRLLRRVKKAAERGRLKTVPNDEREVEE